MKQFTDKLALRKYALQKLRKQSFYRYQASKKINRHLEQILAKLDPQSVLFYLPMSHEVDVRPLLLKERKKRKVYVPFMEGDSFKMVRYSLPLRRAKYGILETYNKSLTIKKVDVIIVPVLAVDKVYKRIGFGKGMYDRFVARLTQRPILLFVQQTKIQSPLLVGDHYDIEADYYITAKTIKHIKK